ncbi:MAG: hypothetical protein WC120_05265 [Parcubacteria group bacterium]|jgi:hypothetical protein
MGSIDDELGRASIRHDVVDDLKNATSFFLVWKDEAGDWRSTWDAESTLETLGAVTERLGRFQRSLVDTDPS